MYFFVSGKDPIIYFWLYISFLFYFICPWFYYLPSIIVIISHNKYDLLLPFLVEQILIIWCLFIFFFTVAQISNPFFKFKLFRNPKNKNAGKFMKLSDFLEMAKNANSLSGVLISIEVSFVVASVLEDFISKLYYYITSSCIESYF